MQGLAGRWRRWSQPRGAARAGPVGPDGVVPRPPLERLARLIYPPRCLACGTLVEDEGALCGPCWRQTPFVMGLVCDLCGLPLPGHADGTGAELCDDCLRLARPWSRGRAALLYEGEARRLVLQLKDADRHDLVAPMARWMARVAPPLLADAAAEEIVVVPVPVHWRRLLGRRYSPSALLARAVARALGLACAPAALRRLRATRPQEGLGAAARHANLAGAIAPAPGRAGAALDGRVVLIVDDVMTSGATMAASAEAAWAAGARDVRTLALARVAKLP